MNGRIKGKVLLFILACLVAVLDSCSRRDETNENKPHVSQHRVEKKDRVVK